MSGGEFSDHIFLLFLIIKLNTTYQLYMLIICSPNSFFFRDSLLQRGKTHLQRLSEVTLTSLTTIGLIWGPIENFERAYQSFDSFFNRRKQIWASGKLQRNLTKFYNSWLTFLIFLPSSSILPLIFLLFLTQRWFRLRLMEQTQRTETTHIRRDNSQVLTKINHL